MAKKLSPVGSVGLKAEAYDLMMQGRASKGAKLARSARRSWNYGEGKKTVIKVGVGLGVATGFAARGRRHPRSRNPDHCWTCRGRPCGRQAL